MHLYYPNQFIIWRAEELEILPEGIKLPKAIGYIPVYDNLDLLKEDFPEAKFRSENWDGTRQEINDKDIRP